MPTISVIVPVYNLEKEISKCILSILLQKFTDFEVIVVDDGSNDGSSSRARQSMNSEKNTKTKFEYSIRKTADFQQHVILVFQKRVENISLSLMAMIM